MISVPAAAAGPARPWMKCVSIGNGQAPAPAQPPAPAPAPAPVQPPAPTQGNQNRSLAPSTQAVGFIFTTEPNNGNELSADVLLLSDQGQVIKQIGHAEVLSSSSNGTITLQQGPDSPFPFSMSLTQPNTDGSVAFIGDKRRAKDFVTGQISNVGLFGSQSLAQMQVQCRMYSRQNGGQSTGSGGPGTGTTTAPAPTTGTVSQPPTTGTATGPAPTTAAAPGFRNGTMGH